jgi:hypothetical protein
MKIFIKPEKNKLIETGILTIWFFSMTIGCSFFTDVPMWPMFFVTISYYMNPDKKRIPSIFLGAFTGITASYVLVKGSEFLSEIIGESLAVSIVLLLVLAVILMGGSVCPLMFNNTAFAYLTIGTIHMYQVPDLAVGWIIMLLFGGGAALGGSFVLLGIANHFTSRNKI